MRKYAVWRAPPQPVMKVNVDGAFDPHAFHGAAGAILRGTKHFHACLTKWFDHIPNVLVAEALACKEGISLAHSIGSQRIVVETDCQVLVSLWEARHSQRSEITGILHLLQFVLRSDGSKCCCASLR